VGKGMAYVRCSLIEKVKHKMLVLLAIFPVWKI
jgi:hypothetical protein